MLVYINGLPSQFLSFVHLYLREKLSFQKRSKDLLVVVPSIPYSEGKVTKFLVLVCFPHCGPSSHFIVRFLSFFV